MKENNLKSKISKKQILLIIVEDKFNNNLAKIWKIFWFFNQITVQRYHVDLFSVYQRVQSLSNLVFGPK